MYKLKARTSNAESAYTVRAFSLDIDDVGAKGLFLLTPFIDFIHCTCESLAYHDGSRGPFITIIKFRQCYRKCSTLIWFALNLNAAAVHADYLLN